MEPLAAAAAPPTMPGGLPEEGGTMDNLARKPTARAGSDTAAGGAAVRTSRPRDPERTRKAILDAATAEFVAHGFAGASVNEIAARANINKRMLYHYFGKKDDLYLAVLEQCYTGIRTAETQLRLGDLPPRAAIEKLVLFTWSYLLDHPEFLSLLNTENMLRGRYLRHSEQIHDLHAPLIAMIADVLERGAASGEFRNGVDPVQLYISIASLGFFYLSNRHTLSTIFLRDLMEAERLEQRGRHIVEMIMSFLNCSAGGAKDHRHHHDK
jgi:AcrR family transcriptional regulator